MNKIHIQAKEKSFYIRILDDCDRMIYENQCVNKVHYESVKFAIAKWIQGNKFNSNILKPIENKETVSI